MYKALSLLALLPTTFAHFLLNYPATLGFDDDKEGTAPCGGFDINFTGNVTNVTVGAFAVALTNTHPQANWLYRFTTSTSEPFNWTDILPVVSQSGLGSFCLPSLSVPNSLVGKQGVIQVEQDAVDGSLYQCAAVNFVEGSTSSPPSVCTNATGVTATITNQTTLGNGTSGSPSATSSAHAATSSSAAAAQQIASGLLALLPVGLMLV